VLAVALASCPVAWLAENGISALLELTKVALSLQLALRRLVAGHEGL
jgi:hypothetical protein